MIATSLKKLAFVPKNVRNSSEGIPRRFHSFKRLRLFLAVAIISCAALVGFAVLASPPVPTVTITPALTPTPTDNDYTRINNAIQTAVAGDTIILDGTFNWTEANAAASWALGSDGLTGGLNSNDDYSILVPPGLNNVTLTANSLGSGTIQGPGDLAAVNLEGVIVFDGGDNQNWTISQLTFLDFDLAIGMFNGAGGTDAFNNTHITSNHIRIAGDLNATVAPADVNQNIGIHFSFGTNQVISGNLIEFQGNGVSDSANSNFSSEVGMQSNTSGGNVYDGLQITNNTLLVLHAQSADPENVLGIWENAHAHSSNITLSLNSFSNLDLANNPATNLQRGYRVTSHSSATTTVTYQNNSVRGANIGFQWLAGQNFSGNQPVVLKSNTITANATGVLVQSQGNANLSFNRIVGNTLTGVSQIASTATAENNWWGCNAGPGGSGCDNVSLGVDANPWLVLGISASPSTILENGTSTVTADMTHNSDGAVPSVTDFLPNLTSVTWGATEGTMSPPSSIISFGQATSTFTSTSPNSGIASATVDNQTVNTPITVHPLVVTITPAGGSATPTDNDYTRINNAVQSSFAGQTIMLAGTFNWAEANAAASWALGSDGLTGGSNSDDDYGITPPANLNNVTLTANSQGDATIQGPGDLANANLEGVLAFFLGDNQGWTISNLRFLDFDLSIGMFNGAGGADAYNNTIITNNYIRVARDLNSVVAPVDVNQNIGIHFSFGTNQVISGNTIDLQGDGVSAPGATTSDQFSSEVGMQSNTSGGAVYDGLQIVGNLVQVLNAQSANPENIRGIWENGHAHTSSISVNGNTFTNLAAGNNPATNLQRGFRVTSHSSATSTVGYQNNTVTGANIGFEWIAGATFGGNQAVVVKGNAITGNGTGVLVQSQGVANLSFNRITGNTATGLNNVDGTVTAENNWWGCNAGPGGTGCDTVTGVASDFNPWLVLGISASPSTIQENATSTVTADMTHNSDAVDTSASGFVPPTPVTFSATNGTMTPPSGTLISGQATSTFTSTSPNSGIASATVDNQTVNTPITVLPLVVTIVPAITPTVTDNDYTRINNAVQASFSGQTIKLLGTFNWTETNAAASWAKGSNDTAGDIDDYSVYPPAGLNGVTFTADNLGDATIQGPGDVPTFDLEGVFFFDGGDNQNWTISNIRFVDFDNAIGMFSGLGGADAFNNTHITNNYILVARDLAGSTNGGIDNFQNIGIHFSFGTNQLISGNTIELRGDGVSAPGATTFDQFSSEVGMQSNTSGGAVYNGLQITNNTIRVLGAQTSTPESLRGIWENAHGHTSNITVSGNTFTNLAAGNDPATNLQRGFRVTSHSSATTTVTYQNNTVSGANIGFEWIASAPPDPPLNFSANQAVVVKSNTITGNGTGVLVQSQGVANLSFNRITGNTLTGLNNVNGTVTAENNWWGCNAGPGSFGCDTVTGTSDFDPWLVLGISAVPSTIPQGGTSTVFADMRINSDGANTSLSGTIPPTPVSFSATDGTMTPPTSTTVFGVANSTFTSTTASSGVACATVDNQELCTTIVVIPSLSTFSIDDVTHNEGNAGTTSYTFTITKTGPTTLTASVDYATANGSATAPSDYTAVPTTSVVFAPADTTKQVTVLVNGDTTVEPDENFFVNLSNASNATISDGSGQGTITNDDTDVTVAVAPSAVPEDGATNLVYTFTRNPNIGGALTVNFSVAGTATFGTDYTQTGAATFTTTSGTVTFGAGNATATVTVDPTPDVGNEPDETVILTVVAGTGYTVGTPSAATGTITNDDAAGGIIQFSSANFFTTEDSHFTTITVTRGGDTSGAATVDYATPDDSDAAVVVPCATINGLASPRCDFTTALGTLRFAAGETSKTFIVLISQDNYVEGPETLTLTLSNLTGGAVFGVPSTATLTIIDDLTEPAQNPIDDTDNFVRQQYHDFLNREPDPSGFAFWTGQINACGTDAACIEFQRANVSAAFYLSIEFQATGYFVERLYKTAYGDATGNSTDGGAHTLAVPIVRYSEFIPDTQEIGQGVIVGAPGFETVLENNKQAFTARFVQRPRFTTAYPVSMTPAQFVDTLNANAGNPLSMAERDQLVADLTAATKTRAQVLRAVADDQDLINAEFNRAFVLMEYFGYLRRNPDAAPDTDHTGFDFWLKKLNLFNGDFRRAEMVKAFIVSGEYRHRAGTP